MTQVLGNLDPYRLLVTGDPIERHHVHGIGGSIVTSLS